MYPVERTDEHTAADAPEDLAMLSSWLSAEEAKHQDFSANRREYRAQMRHRAAEQLRLMELRAQSEAEAAADRAEVEAAAAHAEADAATVRLVAGRAMQATGTARPVTAPVDLASEEEVEHHRRSSLRDAAQHARRAAAERLEAARRAEAAALADSIARREEREIAEAQASVMRQAAHDAESEARSSQRKATLEESLSPDRSVGASGPRAVIPERNVAREIPVAGHRASEGHHQPKPVAIVEEIPLAARDTSTHNDSGQSRIFTEHKDAPGDAVGRGRPRERILISSIPYAEFRRTNGSGSTAPAAEIVNKPPVSSPGVVEFGSWSGAKAAAKAPDPVAIPTAEVANAHRHDGNGKLAASGASDAAAPPRIQVFVGVAPTKDDLHKDSPNGRESRQVEAQRAAARQSFKPPVDVSGPAWLYPNGQAHHSEKVKEVVEAVVPVQEPVQGPKTGDELSSQISNLPGRALVKEGRDAIREHAVVVPAVQDASRWLALKDMLAETDRERNNGQRLAREEKPSPPFLLVYSMAGGVGKTSLVAALGRALSSFGERVLLADTVSHGPLPFYFGARTLRANGVRTFLPPRGNSSVPIQVVNYDLTSRRNDPAARTSEADSELFEDLMGNSRRVNRVVMDLSVCDEWMAGRLAPINPTVLVPLLADMNSIVSLKAIERSITGMRTADGKALQPVYLLNQFDASLPLHDDVRMFLKQQLGDRLLPTVIRRANGVSEALAEGMTVFDYAPESEIATDYMTVAEWLRSVSASTIASASMLRWNEG